MKMVLGMAVGLSPGDFVLDGDTARPPPKGHRPPIFGPFLLRPNGCIWIKMSLGMELGLDPGDFVLDGDPVAPPQKGGGPPNFRPMFIVTKRPDG